MRDRRLSEPSTIKEEMGVGAFEAPWSTIMRCVCACLDYGLRAGRELVDNTTHSRAVVALFPNRAAQKLWLNLHTYIYIYYVIYVI